MTGAQRYIEAERAVSATLSADIANEEGYTGWAKADLLALAQVHATLALAAATAGPIGTQRGHFGGQPR